MFDNTFDQVNEEIQAEQNKSNNGATGSGKKRGKNSSDLKV